MATRTLSTHVSRRAIIAGGAAAVLAGPGLSLPAAAPVAAQPLGADARLFRRIAVAERLRNRHARARRLRDRLSELTWDHPDYPGLPIRTPADHAARRAVGERTGYYPAMLQTAGLFRRYAAAVRRAVATPAQTLPGVRAKLALGLIAARRGKARVYMYEDREWLEYALDDLARLAADGAA